ncbi:MAG: hypothetical protein ACI3W7_06305 [Oscillospiraceae bacterium]
MKLLKKILPLALVLCLLLTVAPAAFALTIEPSGYELDVSEYAPTQSSETGAIGGNYGLFTFDDFFDLAGGQYDAYEDAVNWWLASGVTNGGETWDRFGVDSEFARYDLAFFLYRFYNLSNDDGLWLYDDFSHNPLAGDTNWKFTDAVYACRWSGILGAYEGNNFAPLRTTDAETVLQSLFKVLTWSPEILDDETRAEIEAQTGKPYTETTTSVNAVFPEELVAAAAGYTVDDAVAFFTEAGLFDGSVDPKAPLSKLDAIQILYTICRGTGARTGDKWDLFGSTTVINDYAEDATVSGETFELIGKSPEDEIAGTSLIVAHDGAKVTISDSIVTVDNVTEGLGYQLAYRWGDSMAVVAYGEGTVLTFENTDFHWLDTVERQHGGFFPTAGATILIRNCTIDRQSSGMCYNGTLIYEDCDLTTAGTQTGRMHSSDFFSGVTIYNNCTMNKDGIGEDDSTPTAFNDEAASLYIIDSPYFGNGFGTMTGVATAYAEGSVIDASVTSFTNNTSQLTDVTSYTMVDCDITYDAGIATLQKEAKVDARYIDCGEIILGDGMTLASGEPDDTLCDISIEGAEFGSYSSMRIRLDGTTFSRPLNVYVAPGCELIIEVQPGTELPEVIQDTSIVKTITSYVEKKAFPEAAYELPNLGSVIVREVDWNS